MYGLNKLKFYIFPEKTAIFGKINPDGKMDILDILSNDENTPDPEELIEMINKQCETCSKKDICKNKCDDIIKH